MAANDIDWQIGLKQISQRTQKILDSGQWSDCMFSVGTENNQEKIPAHRLILAIASPVFEAMFYGSMAEKEDKPVEILDVRPQAFKALLKYIYVDEVNFTSFDQVCEICYAAKKYMIPPLVEECTKFIWKDLHPGNVCRAYAFVKLFEESHLLEKCMTMIKISTDDVIRDQSFEEVDISTLKLILSEDTLNCSELELWEGLMRWTKQECLRQSLEPSPANQRKVAEELLPMVRFLTMTPTQFANGPALSSILTQEECFKILMNMSANGVVTVPPSFSSNMAQRKPPQPVPEARQSEATWEQGLCNCAGSLSDIFVNEQLVDCTHVFSVNKPVFIEGIVLPTQLRASGEHPGEQISYVPPFSKRNGRLSHPSQPHGGSDLQYPTLVSKYPELIYAFVQDMEGCRLTYTHFSARVSWANTMEVLFNRPVSVVPHKPYKIVVVLNKMGLYPFYNITPRVTVGELVFSFTENPLSESLVKTLIFRRSPTVDLTQMPSPPLEAHFPKPFF